MFTSNLIVSLRTYQTSWLSLRSFRIVKSFERRKICELSFWNWGYQWTQNYRTRKMHINQTMADLSWRTAFWLAVILKGRLLRICSTSITLFGLRMRASVFKNHLYSIFDFFQTMLAIHLTGKWLSNWFSLFNWLVSKCKKAFWYYHDEEKRGTKKKSEKFCFSHEQPCHVKLFDVQ